jgi:cystathionine beta-synthase
MLESEHYSVSQLAEAKANGTPALVTLAPSGTVRQALNLMSTYGVSQVPVVEGKDCVGSVSEGAMMAKAIAEPKVLDQAVRDVMDGPFPVVDGDLSLDRLTALLSRETPAALVRKNGALVGIVTRYDVLHHVAGIR